MKSFNRLRIIKTWGMIPYVTLLAIITFVFPRNVTYAQISLLGKTSINSVNKDTTDKTCRGQFCGRVFISPSEIKISPESIQGDTVVVNIDMANKTDTVLIGVLKAYDISPPQFIPLDSSGQQGEQKSKGSSLIAEKDEDSPQVSENEMSLSNWLTGFPDSVVIPPHSTITVRVTLRVPKSLKEGSYSGWLGAMSDNIVSRDPPQKPIRMGIISRVRITYEAALGNASN